MKDAVRCSGVTQKSNAPRSSARAPREISGKGLILIWLWRGDALEGRNLATMLGELEETLIPQKVDLLLKKTLRHQELVDHIERVGVVFYDREMTQA
jgi:hypothetical protein